MSNAPASAPAHQRSFSLPTVTANRPFSRPSHRRTPRLRVFTRTSLTSTDSVIAESDESESQCSIKTDATDSADVEPDVPQPFDDAREEKEEGSDDEFPLTPMPLRRVSTGSTRMPLTAGILPSQRPAATGSAFQGLGHGLPSSVLARQGLVFGGGAINIKRDERKALGLRAAVGSFRRRTASTSAGPNSPITPTGVVCTSPEETSPPSPARCAESDLGHRPTSSRSPEIPQSSACSEFAKQQTLPRLCTSSAPTTKEQLEARRQALARVSNHRRIVSEASPRSPAFSMPAPSPMPSLDQIRDWAAQRKASTAVNSPPGVHTESQCPGDTEPAESIEASLANGSTPQPPPGLSSVAPAVKGSVEVSPTMAVPLSKPVAVYRPPHHSSKHALAPSTPAGSSAALVRHEPPLKPSSNLTPLQPVTRSFGQALPANVDDCSTPQKRVLPIIVVEPASALQAGQDALAFAKALLHSTASPLPSPTTRRPGPHWAERENSANPPRPAQGERAERGRRLLGDLAEAQKRRSITMPALPSPLRTGPNGRMQVVSPV